MTSQTEKHILQATGANRVIRTEIIQKLWSNYGDLLRVHLDNGTSVILKHIQLPSISSHPKGFNTDLSRERKMKSYQVETYWYENYNHINLQDQGSPTARLLKGFQTENEFFILLEDLDRLGFCQRLSKVGLAEVKLVLKWLANFHAKFLNLKPNGLWANGTYWHLETRPDELAALEDLHLKNAAPLIDQKLKKAKYQTIVHGDAKLANFCFSADTNEVAAVDFQYVGGGCGMKDVAYFIGSCFNESQCEKLEGQVLDFYFDQLLEKITDPIISKQELEAEWRALYHVAWADFHRFLKGWSPGHWKINSYSEKVSRGVVNTLTNELLNTAQEACLQAGEIVRNHWHKDFKVESKGYPSPSSNIVTEVDHLSQEKIISALQPSIEKYDLGLLAEESKDDHSRLCKDFFWSVDPLDGTIYFSESKEGFAIAIALIDRAGAPLIGVVYDPVRDTLYHAVRGHGAFQNGKPLEKKAKAKTMPLFADRSLQQAENFTELEKQFDIHFIGGAVMNAINALIYQGCYFKYPRNETGGCAIWDLAATSLIVSEAGGIMTSFDGQPLCFNKKESLFYHSEGLMVCGDSADLPKIATFLSEI